jgi:hypothetical protein
MANSDTSRICDRDALLEAITSGWLPKYVFFWGHTPKGSGVGKHVLSQWWPARFTVEGRSRQDRLRDRRSARTSQRWL